jgi:hypothetical protein
MDNNVHRKANRRLQPEFAQYCRLFLFWVILCSPAVGNCAAPPPCHFPLGKPTSTKYCVSVNVQNGFITVIPDSGKLQIGPGFSPQPVDQEEVKQELASYLQGILNRRKLYEFAQMIKPSAPAPPDAAAAGQVSGDTIVKAINNLKTIWPQYPAYDSLPQDIIARLPNLGPESDPGCSDCGLDFETPLVNAKIQPPLVIQTEESFLVMDVDPLVTDVSKIQVVFDNGTPQGSDRGELLTADDVRAWLSTNYGGRFWISKAIKDHFDHLYLDVGLSPTVIVSRAGVARSIKIQESRRVGRILIPGNKAGPDQDTEKLLYIVLTSREFGAFDTSMLIDIPSLSEQVLCIPELHGSKCDDHNHIPTQAQYASLEYLNTWRLSELQAGLQPLGFSVATVNQPVMPGQAVDSPNMSQPVDLQVQKLAKSSEQAVSPPAPQSSDETPPSQSPGTSAASPRPKPSAQAIPTATSRTIEPGAAVGGAPKLQLEPAKPDKIPPPPTQHQYAVGATVIYRPNQSTMVLGLFQLPQMTLPAFLGDTAATVLLKGGTDGANPLGEGSLNADYLWFNHLRKRLSASVNYGTDAISDRILEGESTNQRQTGPSASVNLELIRYIDGWNLTSYVQPLSQSVGLTPQGSSQLNAYVNEVATGVTLNYQSTVTFHPVAFTFNPEIMWGFTSGQSSFWKFSTNSNLHLRLIDSLLVSLDIHGSFGFASVETPVFTVPSLGGADSVRGFRQDSVLGRALWSLQNEVWVPVPGTLKTTNANGIQQFLRKNVRIALFYDVGDMQKTDVNPFPFAQSTASGQFVPGIRQGTGIGLRFIQVPIALKLDWAYGFGQSVSGVNHGRVYLGAATSGAF